MKPTTIIVNTANAPFEVVMPLLAQWEKLANIVTENVTPMPNCMIQWRLTLFRESERCLQPPVEGYNDWAIRCSVSQIQKIYTGGDNWLLLGGGAVVAPIIEISEIYVYKDRTFWKRDVHEYCVNDHAIEDVITALQTGKWILTHVDPNMRVDQHNFVVNRVQLPTG